MSCQCYQIGGPFIAEDPDCPAHGTVAQAEREVVETELAQIRHEVQAWRERFPQYKFRPQDDGVFLK